MDVQEGEETRYEDDNASEVGKTTTCEDIASLIILSVSPRVRVV